MTTGESQRYLDDIARRRGYVLDYHKVMAAQDLDVLRAADQLVRATHLSARSLDAPTKELLSILSLTVLRAGTDHIASHIHVALDLGLSPRTILEAIEMAIPEAGIVAFQVGFAAWRQAVGADGLESSVDVHDLGATTDA